MEAFLSKLDSDRAPRPTRIGEAKAISLTQALQRLSSALQQSLPLIRHSLHTSEAPTAPTPSPDKVSASWLLSLCAKIQSELTPAQLALAVLEAAQKPDDASQQAALFDALGMTEEALEVLFAVTPHLSEIRSNVRPSQLAVENTATPLFAFETMIDIEEERRQILVQEALETAQVVAIAQAELGLFDGNGGNGPVGVTHTIQRKSEQKARKDLDKAQKRAAQAKQRALDAGAILDDSAFLAMDNSTLGEGGLMNRTQQELWEIQQSLLPEGSREYYDKRGLPHGTIYESTDRMEKVIIPPADRNEANLHPRLRIHEVLETDPAKAFEGTVSLNPMQSSVFEIAYLHRDNLLVCAPTGAGKTNVAMLSVVAHFRDVGLIASDRTTVLETGRKVIYVAPMKALAQEVVEKFSAKLKGLRLTVRELTGDMQLTRLQAEAAHVIVTTPEKWDVVTRKSGTDENALGNQCGLLIIDEVHLLADERGAVIESVVSRLHRLVESRQKQARIVGLSATLPNYQDVASFLKVPERGLFFFGPEHRPVPLQQQFIGVSAGTKDRFAKEKRMNEICFDVVLDSLQRGYQVMVFVHSRKGTGDTAKSLAEMASHEGVLERYFVTAGKEGSSGDAYSRHAEKVKKSRNREVGMHFANGMGIHHAGMLRGDRKLTEQVFSDGAIKVLVCTATLAWGVNLPAHTVVIKGTEVYNPEKGGVVDLSILDVQQIFGRAGRPQFDTSGEATMITSIDAFPRYMDKLVRAVPIESNFIKHLADHLNAEVVGGTVTNIQEAVTWLTYTYLYTRMRRNPIGYGIKEDEKNSDPMLKGRCNELVREAAKLLDLNRMIRYDQQSGNLSVADRGRVAAHFYIQSESIATFNEMLAMTDYYTDADLCRVICNATEFRNLKIRQEEMSELEELVKTACPLPLKGAGMDDRGRGLITDASDKAFVLLQAYISRAKIKSFTLITDMNYIASNASRVARAVFEICLKQNSAGPALKLLRIAKSADTRIWWFQTPMRIFEDEFSESVYSSIETKSGGKGYDSLYSALSLLDMQPKEVEIYCRWNKSNKGGRGGEKIQRFVRTLPNLHIECDVQPVTSSVMRFHILVTPNFEWNGRWHGGAQSFWLWVEDGENNRIYHDESILFAKRTFPDAITLDLSIPAFEPMPSQYFIRAISDSWVGSEMLLPVSLDHVQMVKDKTPITPVYDLSPVPVTSLAECKYEQLYRNFKCFNSIQSQLFHVLYHTDSPVLLGAPTGSGKTIVAELALLRMKRIFPKGICVYIAPLKSLARERLKEWKIRLGSAPLRWKILELSGDTHHDQGVVESADVLVCTPEKWDLISRGWRSYVKAEASENAGKAFVKRVKLLVLDEVHLLGEERGAVLEAIVSRTRFISQFVEEQNNAKTSKPKEDVTRIIGLSTALANPLDLADWIGIDTRNTGPTRMRGLYNFSSSVRPVPLTVHVQGYPGRHYCPRMATMNKPCFAAIKEYSPAKPVLIFVASRRQTRLTAFDIISYAAAEANPKRFLKCNEEVVDAIINTVSDEALRHTLAFGIGLHHAGISSHDRDVVETMYLSGKIQVLVATSTLAWGVNTPAHLVIVKGTEYFDGKSSRYVDYPLTDVLQMIGRAGRPGFDDRGSAVVMSTEDKKPFYKKFLYSPFPVESCLTGRIHENLNAEIASGTIGSVLEAVGYLTWTFYARRVRANPSFYGAQSSSEEDVEHLLVSIVKSTLRDLEDQGCVSIQSDELEAHVTTMPLGLATSNFYLLYRTPKQMQFGVRQARKIIANAVKDSPTKFDRQITIPECNICISRFSRPSRVDEISLAWILYALASTHEFDELPVRHNEDILNEELSANVRWGPDVDHLLSGDQSNAYRNPEIFSDPHTKCFLLLQAHLEHAKLPISDYVNDTKSVVENIPRLLAAMKFVACSDDSAAGSFDLVTQFARAKQFFETRTRADEDSLQQLPGFNSEFVRKIQAAASKQDQGVLGSIHEVRQLSRNDALASLNRITANRHSKRESFGPALDTLYAIPNITKVDVTVTRNNDKPSSGSTGKLILAITFQRYKGKRDAFSLNVLLGSHQQGQLLAEDSIRVGRTGTWTIAKEIPFNWSRAKADSGGEDGGMVLRLLWDEVRGFDLEAKVGFGE